MKSDNYRSSVQAIEKAWTDSGAWDEYIETMRQVLSLSGDAAGSSSPLARWLSLPGLCCQAAGGDESACVGITGAWACLQAAAHALDKVEDQDPLDNWLEGLAAGEVINAANGLVFTASLLLDNLYQDDRTIPAATDICQDFYQSILIMASGQHRDMTIVQPDLAEWNAIAGAKSGAFFGLACRSGARLGTGDRTRIGAFGEFGHHLGVLLQLRDDLVDMRPALIEGKRPEELRRSLAIAYAFDVLSDREKKNLSAHLHAWEEDPRAATHLAELLDRCGAGLYLRTEIDGHLRSGLAALQSAEPAQPVGEKLVKLIAQLSEI